MMSVNEKCGKCVKFTSTCVVFVCLCVCVCVCVTAGDVCLWWLR